MYKINEVSSLAGVSTRTLRYYDSINLLSPSFISDNKYRYYTDVELNILQQIMFYKELGFRLEEIKKIINDKDFSILEALHQHKLELLKKKKRIDSLIETVNLSIKHEKGVIQMSNEEKFKHFKETQIKENEEKYGVELKSKYTEESIKSSYDKIRKMSRWEYNKAEELSKEILVVLEKALMTNNPNSELANKVCELHQNWIKMYWVFYTEDAHLELVKMYTEDDRFKAYYEKVGSGAADFLYLAMQQYLKKITKK